MQCFTLLHSSFLLTGADDPGLYCPQPRQDQRRPVRRHQANHMLGNHCQVTHCMLGINMDAVATVQVACISRSVFKIIPVLQLVSQDRFSRSFRSLVLAPENIFFQFIQLIFACFRFGLQDQLFFSLADELIRLRHIPGAITGFLIFFYCFVSPDIFV